MTLPKQPNATVTSDAPESKSGPEGATLIDLPPATKKLTITIKANDK